MGNLTWVSPLELDEAWGKSQAWIEEAVQYSNGRFEASDLLVEIINGVADFFIGANIAIICRVQAYPRKRVYLVQAVGGESGEHDWNEYTKILRKAAATRGCTAIEAYGRPGWRKNAKKALWDHAFSVYEVPI